jgi:hypothetical protein
MLVVALATDGVVQQPRVADRDSGAAADAKGGVKFAASLFRFGSAHGSASTTTSCSPWALACWHLVGPWRSHVTIASIRF